MSRVELPRSRALAAEARWPPSVWEGPLFRMLDERGRRELEAAGRRRALAAGESLFSADAAGDSFFIVAEGTVVVESRGGETRLVRRGQTLGEETFLQRARTASARARDAALVIELPVRLCERVIQRSAGGGAVERTRRVLFRAVVSERLSRLALARYISASDFERLLDAAEVREATRGEPLCSAGEHAGAALVVLDGLVQVEREHDGRVAVEAYLAPGDLYGLDEALAGGQYSESAVALGSASWVRIPSAVLSDVLARAPAAISALQSACEQRRERQRSARAKLTSFATEHAFQGMDRLELARSLLVIDPDSCVRCGHCAWACAETHDGVARLERRGEFVRTQLVSEAASQGVARLFLPNACQHCVRPECLPACPTGAISIGSAGAVSIRAALCTGCGACAKACPWGSIWMAPSSESASQAVAIKCDLCREYVGPACVQACPTEAIQRLEPRSAFAEVGAVVGRPEHFPERAVLGEPSVARSSLAPPAALIAFAAAWYASRSGAVTASGGAGVLLGWVAALSFGVALSYVLPKRALRRWLSPAAASPWRELRTWAQRWGRLATGSEVRSIVKPWLTVHVLAGVAASVAAAAHGGLRFRADWAGALEASFWLTITTGLSLRAVYARAPRALSRIERTAGLPEDLEGDERRLLEELERQLSGRDELVKRIAERLLVPYTRAWLGPYLLVGSGRTLAEEQSALREHVVAALDGRGQDRLAGLDQALRVVVELRALPARRVLYGALRAGLPLHLLCTALCVALLAVHVASVWRMF